MSLTQLGTVRVQYVARSLTQLDVVAGYAAGSLTQRGLGQCKTVGKCFVCCLNYIQNGNNHNSSYVDIDDKKHITCKRYELRKKKKYFAHFVQGEMKGPVSSLTSRIFRELGLEVQKVSLVLQMMKKKTITLFFVTRHIQ